MKKILVTGLLTVGLISNSFAHGNNWVAPAIIGGVVGYSLARPYYNPPPVYIAPPVYNVPPVYNTAPPPCYPMVPVYSTIWTNDAYGRSYPMTVFNGCR
jgi:hypothetical protein